MVATQQKQSYWFNCICVLSVNLLSFSANVGYSWTSPFLPKLNGNVDPDKNPLPKPITLLEESWITSLHSLGALSGLLIAGVISQKLGKKMTLICFSIPVFVSNLMLIIANSVIEFYISRFLLGIGTACVFSIIPSYVAEITEVRNRGKAGMAMPLMAASSHLLVVSVGPYVSIRTFACFSLIPSLLFYLIFLPFVPDSPYNYVSCNKLRNAEKSLQKLRRRDDVKGELEDIVKNSMETKTTGSFKEIINSKTVKKSLLICFGLILSQQITGIQPVTAYQQEIFRLTESIIPSHLSVIYVGIFQFFATIFVLSIIDKVGRKVLFLCSYIGISISLIILGTYFFIGDKGFNLEYIYWIPLVCIIMHMAFFRIGAGPVCWTIIGEIFPSNLKGQLSAVVTAEMVILTFVSSMIFPVMLVSVGPSWTFWIFGFLSGLSILFIWKIVPEIKGKSFLEIQEILKK